MGLLEILEEESRTPQATDEGLVRRFHRTFATNKHYERTHKGDRATFGIRHYAGMVRACLHSNSITYVRLHMIHV